MKMSVKFSMEGDKTELLDNILRIFLPDIAQVTRKLKEIKENNRRKIA